MEKHITTPITQKITKDLKSGDYVYITGEIDVYKRQGICSFLSMAGML